MKTLFLLSAMLLSVFTFSATAQNNATFNDKSDISVTYQFLTKDVNTRSRTDFKFDESRDEHGANVGYTYFFNNKAVGLGGELSANFGDDTSTITYLGTVTAKRRQGKLNPFVTAGAGVSRERAFENQLAFPSANDADTGASFMGGAGLDYKVGKNTSIRILRVDYLQTRSFGAINHNARFSTGIVF